MDDAAKYIAVVDAVQVVVGDVASLPRLMLAKVALADDAKVAMVDAVKDAMVDAKPAWSMLRYCEGCHGFCEGKYG